MKQVMLSMESSSSSSSLKKLTADLFGRLPVAMAAVNGVIL